MHEVFGELSLPAVPISVEQMLRYIRYLNLLGLLLPLAIIVALYLSRHSFYTAARNEDVKTPA
jgi:hypothetical protein